MSPTLRHTNLEGAVWHKDCAKVPGAPDDRRVLHPPGRNYLSFCFHRIHGSLQCSHFLVSFFLWGITLTIAVQLYEGDTDSIRTENYFVWFKPNSSVYLRSTEQLHSLKHIEKKEIGQRNCMLWVVSTWARLCRDMQTHIYMGFFPCIFPSMCVCVYICLEGCSSHSQKDGGTYWSCSTNLSSEQLRAAFVCFLQMESPGCFTLL